MSPKKAAISSMERQEYTKLHTDEAGQNKNQNTNFKGTSNNNATIGEVPKYDENWTITEIAMCTKFLLVCLFFAVMLFISSPEPPSIRLDSLSVPKFNITSASQSMVRLQSVWDLHLTIKNEAKWKGYFDKVRCTLYNEEERGLRPLKKAGVDPFRLEPGEEKGVGLKMEVNQKRDAKNMDFETFTVRVYVRSSFQTPRSAWVVGKSFPREYACSELKMKFEGNKGELVDDVPMLCADNDMETDILADDDYNRNNI